MVKSIHQLTSFTERLTQTVTPVLNTTDICRHIVPELVGKFPLRYIEVRAKRADSATRITGRIFFSDEINLEKFRVKISYIIF